MEYTSFLNENQLPLGVLFQPNYAQTVEYIKQLLNDIAFLQNSDELDYIYNTQGEVEYLLGRLHYEFDIVDGQEKIIPFLIEGNDYSGITIYKNWVQVSNTYDESSITYPTSELIDILKRYIFVIENKIPQKANFINKIRQKIASFYDLSTRRPLLAREQIELDFLQKMLKADSLADLQNIENEINSTPTDPKLITRLQKYVTEKKAFY